MPRWQKALFVSLVALTIRSIDLTPLSAEPLLVTKAKEQLLLNYITELADHQRSIPADRLAMLSEAASGIRKALAAHGAIDLVFVCTHNSRRSQFGQAWAAIAAAHFHQKGIRSHSCGTEATACNTRTIAALERAGLSMARSGTEPNPIYSATFDAAYPPLELFSKTFDHGSLPKKNFVAMICCDDADQNCPHIPGAIERVRLSYVDPKVSDDRSDEAKVYDERCLQIATEMFALMRMVAND